MTAETEGGGPPKSGVEGSGQAPRAPARRGALRRHLGLLLAAAGLAAVSGVNVFLIESSPWRQNATPAVSATASSAALPEPDAGSEGAPESEPIVVADAGPTAEDDAAPADEEGPVKKPTRRPSGSVERAAGENCSTASVDGLSRQIIAEARCIDGNAFARVPARRNLSTGAHVFLYLDAPARDHLVRVLDNKPGHVLKVHSALRTVAQQYLLWQWAASKRCGIQLATRPGESNHETGLALDVGEHGAWRAALEGEGFHWLGAIDRVHFDFAGPGATHHDGLDVLAFQRLWNRNHPTDTIPESRRYDASTAVRLKKSPASGFPVGARCGAAHG